MDAAKLRKFWSLVLEASPDRLTGVSETAIFSQLSAYINSNLHLNATEKTVFTDYLQTKRQLILDVLAV